MSTLKTIWFSLFLIAVFTQCVSPAGDEVGGTETGTTDSNNSADLSRRFAAMAGGIIPTMVTNVDNNVTSPLALTYGDEITWNDVYKAQDNTAFLEEIFGSPEQNFRTVKKIRVLLELVEDQLNQVVGLDPDFDCIGGELVDTDSLEIAHFGVISNGPADDRHYQCVLDFTELNDGSATHDILLYGEDVAGNIRIVSMYANEMANTEDTETRGDGSALYQVYQLTYGQLADNSGESAGLGEGDNGTVGDNATAAFTDFIAFNYTQSTVYNGADGVFGSLDDVVFSSWSQITGGAEFDADGEFVTGTGDFKVSHYDRDANQDGAVFANSAQTMGRGSYGDGDYSLFSIEADFGTVADNPGTFCLIHNANVTGLPDYAAPENCAVLEEDYGWGDTELPFDLPYDLEALFEANELLPLDQFIEEDGADFVVPEYEKNG